ncbi:MAG: O-methyltransferase [Planctomycetota bacterium]|nr:MAG: O-methyltransferase [Planctomycetota bacterium]
MSSASDAVTDRHYRYIAAHACPEDPRLRELKRAAAQAGIPEIWIAPEQAEFMRILLLAARARRVVEVGTLAGYSAISMALVLPLDGRVDTIELEPRHADFAEHWIQRFGLDDRIRVHRGAGAAVLSRFGAGSADAGFIDADKENYPLYLRELLRIVRPGGLIMADNAFAFGQLLDPHPADPGVTHIRAFNDLVASTPNLRGIIVPFGDGLWVAVKEPSAA